MSTVRTNNVQVGQSVTATNNFTLYQPTVPDGTVRLGVGNTGATTLDVVTANSSGNVGIGTSSPSSFSTAKLVVNQGADGDVVFVRGGSTRQVQLGTSSTMGYINADNTSGLGFNVNTTERARIDSSGNLLVNATALADYFTGGRNAFGFDIPNGARCISSRNTTASSSHFVFYNPNGTVGNIASSGTGTSYNTTSDYRLKADVQPMVGALAKVAALKPVTYKWKTDGADGEGFIAHELAKVVPQCVSGEKDAVDAEGNPVYQGIDTSFLVATLTAAIQELNAKVAALEERLASTGQTGQNPV